MKQKRGFGFVIFTTLFLIVPGFVSADEVAVREYFADVPAMIDIAKCESGFRQYTDAGNAYRGGWGGKMIGVFQLHSDYHVAPANSMGIDIETLDGNLAYARHLYESEGLTPWAPCLGAVSEVSLLSSKAETVSSSAKTTELSTEERDVLIKKIAELQRQVYVLQIELLKMQLAELQR